MKLFGDDPAQDLLTDEEIVEGVFSASRAIAYGRNETESCQASTPGRCIDHALDDKGCECW